MRLLLPTIVVVAVILQNLGPCQNAYAEGPTDFTPAKHAVLELSGNTEGLGDFDVVVIEILGRNFGKPREKGAKRSGRYWTMNFDRFLSLGDVCVRPLLGNRIAILKCCRTDTYPVIENSPDKRVLWFEFRVEHCDIRVETDPSMVRLGLVRDGKPVATDLLAQPGGCRRCIGLSAPCCIPWAKLPDGTKLAVYNSLDRGRLLLEIPADRSNWSLEMDDPEEIRALYESQNSSEAHMNDITTAVSQRVCDLTRIHIGPADR